MKPKSRMISLVIAVFSLLFVSVISSIQAGEGKIIDSSIDIKCVEKGVVVTMNLTRKGPLAVGDLSVKLIDKGFNEVASLKTKVLFQGDIVSKKLLLEAKVLESELSLYRVDVEFEGDYAFARKYRYQGGQDVILVGKDSYIADSEGSLRLVVRRGGNPLAGADVELKLALGETEHPLFKGKSLDDGTVPLNFRIPATTLKSGEFLLSVSSDKGAETIRRRITIRDPFRIMLVTDKPLYQPGQTMHVRALALREADLRPVADSELLFEIFDAKGNKLAKDKRTTSRFGVGSTVFSFADEINMGLWKIKASIGDISVEKDVDVKRYVLPKFKVGLELDKTFFLPKDKVKGKLSSAYFFGKPVADSKVTIVASAFDIGFSEFARLEGTTDAEGFFEFEFDLPANFVGQAIAQGNAVCTLTAEVIDNAKHKQTATRTFNVAKDPISISVVTESGKLLPGLPNRIHILTSYPDGTPVKTRLNIVCEHLKKEIELDTSEMGLATIELNPGELDKLPTQVIQRRYGRRIYKENTGNHILPVVVKAGDSRGNKAEMEIELGTDSVSQSLILRTDNPIYKVGDVMRVSAITSQAGPIYIDIIRLGQTALTKTVEATKGENVFDLPLSAELFGPLTLHAYMLMPNGEYVRDTRRAVVKRTSDLTIEIRADKKTYKPAEKATVDFKVTDRDGKGVESAIGVSIVDEAVFAMAEATPGLAKLFFMLENELMKPKYQIQKVSIADMIAKDENISREKRHAAEVAMAKASETDPNFEININTQTQKEKLARQKMSTLVDYYYSIDPKSYLKNDVVIEVERLLGRRIKDASEIIDPWGMPFRFKGGEDEIVSVISNGPDGQFGTTDDIAYNGSFPMRDYRGFEEGMGIGGGGGDRLRRNAPMQPQAAKGDFGPNENAEPMDDMDKANDSSSSAANDPGQQAAKKTTRVRKYFPETMYFNPQVITDKDGKAQLTLDMADSITSWRISAEASSMNGSLGQSNAPMVCFQDFFIDIDLPVALTQGDQVNVPVALYNYLKEEQEVRVELTKADWFELTEPGLGRSVILKPGEVRVVFFPLKAVKIGTHRMTVHGTGTTMSDAIERSIRVLPDGEMVEQVINKKLEGDSTHEIDIPQAAIDGASKIFVKIYPGVLAQVVEGMDKIFRMPNGCFEQTSSTTYPNVLLLDYMKKAGLDTPELRMKAETYIRHGYQRLVSYEVAGGGFQVWGQAPANRIITAYGLMEFADMSEVYPVDENLISRTRDWLIRQQLSDGSWEIDRQGLCHGELWSHMKDPKLGYTAYIAKAIARTGYKGAALDNAMKYIGRDLDRDHDVYTLSLVASALSYIDPKGNLATGVFRRLLENAHEKDGTVYFSHEETAWGSRGNNAIIEITGLVAEALIRAGRNTDVAQRALGWLVSQKDAHGTWHSTHATISSLKALIGSLEGSKEASNGSVVIELDGQKMSEFAIDDSNSDLMRLIDFGTSKEGKNVVKIGFAGKGNMLYSIVTRYYLPHGDVKHEEPFEINLAYDKTELATDDTVTVTATVHNKMQLEAKMVMVDLGLPPGFTLISEDVDKMVKDGLIVRYSLTSRQIIVYLDHVKADATLTLKYRLVAKYPLKAKTPQSRVYNYYNPEEEAFSKTEELTVKNK